MILYHKFHLIRKLTSKFLKSHETKISMKQVMSVTRDHFPVVQTRNHKLERKVTFINECLTDPEFQ